MKEFYKVVQLTDGSKRFDTIEAALEEAQNILTQSRSGQRRLVLMKAIEVVEPPPAKITLRRTPITDYNNNGFAVEEPF